MIEDLLRNEDIRIVCGFRWMVFDHLYSASGEYVVFERKKYKTCGVAVYRGDDLPAALNMLQAAI